MANSQKKFSNIILIILSAIIVGLAAFFSSYYFFMNKSLTKYKTKLNFEITNINKVNTSVSQIKINEDSIKSKDRIINTMQKNTSSLQNYLYAIKTLNPGEKYTNDHENLINGVQSNILIYKQVSSICKSIENIDGKTLNKSLNDLDKYINETLNFYSQISIRNVKIDLPNETLNFLNSFKSQVEKQAKTTISSKVIKHETNKFIDYLNDITIKFNNFKKDYINDIRKGVKIKEYSALLNEIANDEISLNALKSNLSILSVPSDANIIFDNFSKTLDDYNYYLENLRYNLNIEELTCKNDAIDKSSLKKLYTSSRDDLEQVEKSYNNFLDLFAKFKNY
ncbi:conserved hypothetical protein [Clostridium botulinum C str. Eklund]|nr:conserved hypothetical protein [Clostridium botulinum C str. Eklund]NEZ48607.1 hypothetical protein [Clostridium botulinum]